MRYAIFASCVLVLYLIFIAPHTTAGPSVADSTPTASAHPGVATYARDIFTNAVAHQTGEEIVARFGKPDSTQSLQDGAIEYWYYRGLTVDATTGTIDRLVQIRLERSMDQIRQVSVIREVSVSFN